MVFLLFFLILFSTTTATATIIIIITSSSSPSSPPCQRVLPRLPALLAECEHMETSASVGMRRYIRERMEPDDRMDVCTAPLSLSLFIPSHIPHVTPSSIHVHTLVDCSFASSCQHLPLESLSCPHFLLTQLHTYTSLSLSLLHTSFTPPQVWSLLSGAKAVMCSEPHLPALLTEGRGDGWA